MKKNRTEQKFLLFFLTAAMILSMYNVTALAEPETPEVSEPAELSEETETPEEPEVPKPPTVSENTLTVSENTLTVSENSVVDIVSVNRTRAISGLGDDVLKEHSFRGQSPEGAVVNLFDYWQIKGEPETEYIWDDDYKDDNTGGMIEVRICNMGISQGHLLRFGQTKTDLEEEEKEKRNYGAWNMYSEGQPYQGIVQNTLGADGFPRLNFEDRPNEDFGRYAAEHKDWLDEYHRTESLAYLFSVTQDSYKASFGNVQGLFQMDQKGYYDYDSQKNFAEFDKANSRFILYDSPGVGTTGYYGQFFPFNEASEVFDTEYDITDEEHPYLLSYVGKDSVQSENASFLSCNNTDPLNHYIGMTLEVPFLQTVGGCLEDDSPMTFEFSGDDDVWIFIDGVLVADLGGIHDAQTLSINFADGMVSIMNQEDHTLLDSFKTAGRSDDGFYEETFAGNTVHTLKMFYLERGHMASNLSLRFNVVVVEDPKSNDPDGSDPGGSDPGDDPEDPPAETEKHEEASGTHSDAKADSSAHPAESELSKNAIGSPQTGDDSLIGWWAALSLISLLGIGATVCNMVLWRGRDKKRG